MCECLVFNLHRSIHGSNPFNYLKNKKESRFKINFFKKKLIMLNIRGDEGQGRVLGSRGSSLK